ncbi:protein aurora borealis [Orussus abietinus]|uniref:protein aurora borealis n=1 Tax=Orussus abietinus TaxID=222816 RepID=UPI00062596C3|nr:protein aurora borealis [Orussus abietinus]
MDQETYTLTTEQNNCSYKSPNSTAESPKSIVYQGTPVKHSNEIYHKQTAYQNRKGGFTVLPNYITPPSGFTKFVPRNPFESNLTNKLHLSVMSPTIFAKVTNPSQGSPEFTWSVEELASMQPVKIEEFPIQHHCTDPEIEINAQAAINKFFSENEIVPSPWDDKKTEVTHKLEIETPTRPYEDLNGTRDSYKSKKDAWTQTVLSLPVELPKDVEEALKPYLTFTQDQNVETDDINSSNNSLRRKLFFNHNDHSDDDEDNLSMSPMSLHGSLGIENSPPQSGMFAHGTPLRELAQHMRRNHGTPLANLSPPNMSPIGDVIDNMSCESIKSRSRSVARLDFTVNMSIETSPFHGRRKSTTEHDDSMESVHSKIDVPAVPLQINDSMEDNNTSGESNRIEDNCHPSPTEDIVPLPGETTLFGQDEKKSCHAHSNNCVDIVNRLYLATDLYKIQSSESSAFQQSSTFSGVSGQQSTFGLTQDTGYQTYSTNNASHFAENNCSLSPSKQHTCWDERILLPDDEVRLSDWKGNMKYMCSSTPSKYMKDENR